MYRTHTCGCLRAGNVNETVTLAGWVQKVRNLGAMTFIDLRDRYGLTQIVVEEHSPAEARETAARLGREWVIQVTGKVIERESKKYPLQRKIGFRLTGMRVFNTEKQEFDVYGKKYGYSLTEETLPDMFTNYFSFVKAELRQAVIRSVIQQLESILEWFELRGHLQFICTSVLIIFEGNTESDYRPIVRLVDFAHVRQLPEDQRDEGFIVGLKWILNDLKSRVEE